MADSPQPCGQTMDTRGTTHLQNTLPVPSLYGRGNYRVAFPYRDYGSIEEAKGEREFPGWLLPFSIEDYSQYIALIHVSHVSLTLMFSAEKKENLGTSCLARQLSLSLRLKLELKHETGRRICHEPLPHSLYYGCTVPLLVQLYA